MAFCGKCGVAVNDGVAFCPACSAEVGVPQPAAIPSYIPQARASGLSENVAGALCYLLGWLTGIIFLLIDKRPFVRFHAAQSIVVFGILHIIRFVLAHFWLSTAYTGLGSFGIAWMLLSFVGLVTLVAWVVLMILAFQGKRFEVPGAAPLAKSLVAKM